MPFITVQWTENDVKKTGKVFCEGPEDDPENLKKRIHDKTGILPKHQVFSVNIDYIIMGIRNNVFVSSNQ